jgi:hypothetical protein
MLMRRFQYPNTTGLILRRTYPELYKSHIVKLFEEFPELTQYWRAESKELYFPENGSRLFFGSAQHSGDMSSFYSSEFTDIMPDEAQEFSKEELERLSGSNRCTTNQSVKPGMLFTFMPGLSESGLPPIGLDYLKRVFVDQEIRDKEHRHSWAFLQAFAWDNYEWARKELEPEGVTEEEFYAWDEDRRRDFFLSRTEFGATLDAITNTYLRDAWLFGKWGVFQGQYFQNFQYERDTVDPEEIKIAKWHRRWMSGDWGDYHPACFHWHAEDEYGNVTTYREFWCKGIGEEEMGREIGRLNAGDKLSNFFFSWDAFGKLNKFTKKSIVKMIGDAMPKDMPQPTPADASPGSRISGWRLMSQMLDAEAWKISRACPKLIECLPTLVRDMQKNPEDVLKVDHSDSYIGDDPADCARYGLQNMLSVASKPWQVLHAKRVAELKETIPDITVRNLEITKILAQRQQSLKDRGMVNSRSSARARRWGS